MPNLTLRGPGKLGATECDEHFTAAIVARLAAVPEDVAKVEGPRLAAMVLPARRALWRLLEQHRPLALAAALRDRLSTSDQTGKGGVRELREALADWLDPPLRCRRCARPIRDRHNPEPCRLSPDRGLHAQRRTPRAPLPCRARTGRAHHASRAVGTRNAYGRLLDGSTLALFTPVQADPPCMAAAAAMAAAKSKGKPASTSTTSKPPKDAAAKMSMHGGPSAYDLAVDRDCRILLAALATPPVYHGPPTREEDARARTLAAARRAFERALEQAMRHNGRLVLGVQARYFTPKGSVTRADLLQGGLLGLRRALLDYDSRVAKISTYAINWIYQGMGEVFSGRDAVAVPDWARRMRVDVEEAGVDPSALLGALEALPEAWGLQDEPDPRANPPPPPLSPWALMAACYDLAEAVLPGALAAHAAEVRRLERKPDDAAADDVVSPPLPTDHSLAEIFARAAVGPSRKPRPSERAERARERVSLAVAQALGLGERAKGGALLTALRFGASQVVVATADGERDDAHGGGGDDSASAGAGRKDRIPEHLREDSDDVEARAAEEQELHARWRLLLRALEAVRKDNPEAAEVVRRRHGLDGGDPETFEGIAESGLVCTGRMPCRESVRKMYAAATKRMEAAVQAGLDAAVDAVADSSTIAPPVVMSEATMRALATFARRRGASLPLASPVAVAAGRPVIRPARAAKAARALAVLPHDDAVHHAGDVQHRVAHLADLPA